MKKKNFSACDDDVDDWEPEDCQPGGLLTPIFMTAYMLIANVVLVNLIIAVMK